MFNTGGLETETGPVSTCDGEGAGFPTGIMPRDIEEEDGQWTAEGKEVSVYLGRKG